MTTSQPGVRSPAPENAQSIKRRGLFAAAWAVVAAIVVRSTTQPVEAGVDGDVVLGDSNFSTAPTSILNSGDGSIALNLEANAGGTGIGLRASGSAYGVQGFTGAGGLAGAGIYGSSQKVNSAGVFGQALGAGSMGVQAKAENGYGLVAATNTGVGVLGLITGLGNSHDIAIYGQNVSPYRGPQPGAGGFGVYGLSGNGPGVVGATACAGGAAIVGATNGVSGAYAGSFYGTVVVGGDFTVVGGAKSAAVPHPDGSHRRLYCLESPESWFEDFGKGQLECGRAEIAIDPDFAAVADLRDYHVFVTLYDAHNDAMIGNRTTAGFTVQTRDGESRAAFSWRVVAKRKDITGPRLEPVTIPRAPILPPVPDVPPSTPPTPTHRR